ALLRRGYNRGDDLPSYNTITAVLLRNEESFAAVVPLQQNRLTVVTLLLGSPDFNLPILNPSIAKFEDMT
ncbi:hypothetical protein HAX54_035693, partial [Datura stramonium]|nr:hypothetical protein [Datura stramonium]